ncbi:MAG: phosphate ABC transporter substrate-binding protein PstS [Acidimicrobiales bacterium]
MKHPRKSLVLPVALLSLFGLVATACGDDKADTTTTTAAAGGDATTTTVAAYDYASLTGTLNGSGSSFQDALEQTVKGEFEKKATGVKVNYAKSGSSAGKADLAGNTVQFAGTDSLIKDADKASFTGGQVLYFPIAAAPITVSFHLTGVADLTFSADTLAGIFSGAITTWNDPKIATDNPDAKLPSTPIAVVHRSDGSGTTSNFTKYLKKAAPTAWTLDAGDTVNWPATTQGAEKNSGVAALIGSTEGAVGYVDLADSVSAKLDRAKVINAAGKAVEPKLPGASAALAGATINPDLTYDPLDAPGDAVYPITSPTWVIVYKTQADPKVAAALKGYLNFMLTEGQKLAPTVGYAPLPADLAKQAIAQLDQIG